MNNWISVEDRLPEDEDDVLTICNGIPTVAYLDVRGHWEAGGSIDVSYDMSSVVLDGIVTHWMPLPEPPKEAKR